jgi:hypothetical protein
LPQATLQKGNIRPVDIGSVCEFFLAHPSFATAIPQDFPEGDRNCGGSHVSH